MFDTADSFRSTLEPHALLRMMYGGGPFMPSPVPSSGRYTSARFAADPPSVMRLPEPDPPGLHTSIAKMVAESLPPGLARSLTAMGFGMISPYLGSSSSAMDPQAVLRPHIAFQC